MKNQNCCPGCSRHCCLDKPKCKYGCRYCAKLQAEKENKTAKKHKWEKYVNRNNAFGMTIRIGRKLKKALLKKEITEAQLLHVLNGQERDTLAALLEKINFALEESGKTEKDV